MKTLLLVFIAALTLLWGWDVANAPASGAHPMWQTRQEMLYLSGLLSIGLMSLVMFLATRPAWLETPLGGMDRIYRTHKWAGILAGVFALMHWLIEMSDDILKATIGRAGRLPKEESAGLLESMRDLAEDLGEWGIYVLIALLLLTLWKAFPYRPWRFLHRAMPVIYLILAFHAALMAPTDYWQQPVGWLLGALLLAGSYGAARALLGSIGRQRQFAGEVMAIEPPVAGVLTVDCRLSGQWAGHRPGQFAFVTFEASEGAHPFTIASADRGDGTIRFQIKALGDYTRRLASRLHPGQQVRVEGPYGRFDIARADHRAQQIWVAGGIGVTPFLAWLESLQDKPEKTPKADLHYCTRDRADDPFVDQLEALCRHLPSIRLHLHGSQQGETLDAARMMQGRPVAQPGEIWFCGPSGLAKALRAGLQREWSGRIRFHQEAFEMR